MSDLHENFLAACERGDISLIKTLTNKVDINIKNEQGFSGLALAVRSGHIDIVKHLLTRQADLNSVNEAGQSVLFLSCWNNREECAKILLASGANVNHPDNRGWTPLIIAVYHNYISIVQLLLDYGADLSLKDCFGKRAVERARSAQIVSLLENFERQLEKVTKISSARSEIPENFSLNSERNTSVALKMQEDIQNHVRAQSKKIEKELCCEWSEFLEHCLNEEISQAEAELIEEIEIYVGKALLECYMKLRDKCFKGIEKSYERKGFRIYPSRIEAKFDAKLGLSRTARGRRPIEKIRLECKEMPFNGISNDSSGLKLEVVRYIEKSIGSLVEKFEEVCQDVIIEEISCRIMQAKTFIAAEVQEFIAETGQLMRKNLEKIADEREKEIITANQEKKAKAAAEGSSTFNSNQDTRFAEVLTRSQAGQKLTGTDYHSHTNSITQDPAPKAKKSTSQISFPRTDPSSMLQQFLKK